MKKIKSKKLNIGHCNWCLRDLKLISKYIVKDRKTKEYVVRYARFECVKCKKVKRVYPE